MHEKQYAEIDVSDWDVSGEEDLGTKPKRWLNKPETSELWLMKDATFSKGVGNRKYRKGDDWAERIACGVAQTMGLPVAEVELAVDRRGEAPVNGTVCRSVLQDDETLINGDELMEEHSIPVSRSHRESYTVESVFQALEGVDPPSEVEISVTAWTVFIGYLALDALIGNTDRHEENWSAIKPAEAGSRRRLSPTFDHASSMGFLLSDEERQQRLSTNDGNRTPEGFADRAKTPFAKKPHPITALNDAIALGGQHPVAHWIGHIQHVDHLLEPIWAIPDQRMSSAAKAFAERMLRHNWAKMTT